MTDLEICKRIAEIEGVSVRYDDNKFYGSNYFRCDTHHDLAPVVYSPLKNDALCFQLMVKHKVYIDYFGKHARAAMKNDTEYNDFEVDVVDMSMNKAICLAIIESSK